MQMDVFTSSRKAEKMSEVPGNIMMVTRQQIDARGYRNLGDALKDLPVDNNFSLHHVKQIEVLYGPVADQGLFYQLQDDLSIKLQRGIFGTVDSPKLSAFWFFFV